MLEAGLLQEHEEEITETDLNFDFSIGSEDLAFDDFKDDAEEVTETGESLEEEEALHFLVHQPKRIIAGQMKSKKRVVGQRHIALEFEQRKKMLMDEIDRRTEACSSTKTKRLSMKDLKHQKQKLDKYDAEMEAQFTASLLSGATSSLPGTDATEPEEATSENKSKPWRITRRLCTCCQNTHHLPNWRPGIKAQTGTRPI
ncbi:hypothetical protein L202_06272 [Cryptococcus amylolentus CBS 6039]|uniref:Uncharacterized protein n=1 Tax=Cryptococcus amylolentus CBS 6039 TaxID=1295533 RepID=A0A1E3HFE0_9TREE|nr:hypothetical protein L202_06272 [Cryptococcus amylolentus CBS 6039]ODN75052.1 hypothetical protein L202_06272 [Cryptococcus amylolentus CBS 6039]